jgi:hypothetical protein
VKAGGKGKTSCIPGQIHYTTFSKGNSNTALVVETFFIGMVIVGATLNSGDEKMV